MIQFNSNTLLTFVFLLTSLACHQLIAHPLTSEKKNDIILDFAKSIYSEPKIQKLTSSTILTVIDFSVKPIHRRLWVIDIENEEILFHTLVANGVSSSHFSNKPHSHESSIGVFLTGRTYYGRHGLSLELNGIDGKFNNNAKRRHLVVHKAKYATRKFIHIHHTLGRSWGCFAIAPRVSHDIIDTIKNGTILIAYYPNKEWLNHSPYISPSTPRLSEYPLD